MHNTIYVEVGNQLQATPEAADSNCSAYVVLESMKACGYTVDSIRYDTDLLAWVVFTAKGPFF